jgi:hypothetical protein
MKTRNFIAKAIASIVNLERYPNLFVSIFNNYEGVESQVDHNKIHGLFEVLNCIIEKNSDPFRFIKIDEFVQKLRSLVALKHVPVNFSSFVILLSKIYFKSGGEAKSELLMKMIEDLEMRAIGSLQDNLSQKERCLALPGTHDFLASIAFNWSIISEAGGSTNVDAEIARLASFNVEYSMNLERGVLEYLRKADRVVSSEFYGRICATLRQRAFEAVKDSQTIRNNLNLKIVRFRNRNREIF